MKIFAIIIAAILMLGLLALIIWLAVDLIRTIKAKKNGNKPTKKPRKEKDIDFE